MIEKTFAYHTPSAKALETLSQLRHAFSGMKQMIEVMIPEGRERAVALTELEASALWAIQAIVQSDPKCEPTTT